MLTQIVLCLHIPRSCQFLKHGQGFFILLIIIITFCRGQLVLKCRIIVNFLFRTQGMFNIRVG